MTKALLTVPPDTCLLVTKMNQHQKKHNNMNNNSTTPTVATAIDERPEAEKVTIGAIQELHRRYPQSHMCIIGCHPKSINSKEAVYSNFYQECGSPKMVDTAAVDCCLEDTRVANHYRNVFLTFIANASRSDLDTLVSRRLHDAVIDYARELKLNISGLTYYCSGDEAEDKKPAFIHTMGQTLSYNDDVEAHISELEKELARLRDMRNPATLTRVLTAEIKRLRKAGDLEGVARKTVELNRILDAEKKRLDDERHKKEVHEMKVKQAAMAREAKLRKRLKAEEQKRIEAEKDTERERQRSQQAARNAAMKARQQKKAEEQAERKKRKRKAKEDEAGQRMYKNPMFANL